MNVSMRGNPKMKVKVHRTHPWWEYVLAWFRKAPAIEVKPKVRATIHAVVTRADGTVEDKGVIWAGDAQSSERG